MPDLNFVLPHWLYWLGLVLFPLIAMVMARRRGGPAERGRFSLGLGYVILVTAGFLGMHRFYLKSMLGFVYILPFVGILFANAEGRDARVVFSNANNAYSVAEFKIERAEKLVKKNKAGAEEKLAKAKAALVEAETARDAAIATSEKWSSIAGWLAVLIALGMAVDAVLIPGMVRRQEAALGPDSGRSQEPTSDEVEEAGRGAEQDQVSNPATKLLDGLSRFSGEYAAYWSLIAVFVYYYEVIARYIFNSPTNWAHEGMFLMFGMQYLISGAYAYWSDSHVRVDIFYARLSRRRQAISDLLTSVFFFIFAGTMVATGWIFMWDSINVNEVSFTEWAIQYWPVKCVMTLGAALILLQGLSRVLKDVTILTRGQEAAHGA